MRPMCFKRRAPMHLRIASLQNLVACCYFVFMTIVTTLVIWFEILPLLYRKDTGSKIIHKLFVSFLFVNVLGNYVLCVRTKTTTRKVKLGNLSNASYCKMCKRPRPPRAHHCCLCQACVLKQDHHCFFMASCIGYNNQKHFIMYCFYVSIGAYYSVIQHVQYLSEVFDVKFKGPHTFITLIVDLIRDYPEKAPPSYYLLLLAIMYTSLIMGLVTTGFFLWQMSLSLDGQTTHEAYRGDKTYSLGSRRANLRDVFGQRWLLVLLLPVPQLQNGDGVYEYTNQNPQGTHMKSGKNECRPKACTISDSNGKKKH